MEQVNQAKQAETLRSCKLCRNAIVKNNKIFCGSTNEDDEILFKRNGIKSANECKHFQKIRLSQNKEITLDRALRFILAGKAEFTLVSGKTGRKINYLLERTSENKVYWVSSGKDFENLEYLGVIYFYNSKEFRFLRVNRGKGSYNSVEIKAILYTLNHLFNRKYDINLKVLHNGRCGKCGQLLKDVGSQLYGIDETCRNSLVIPFLVV